MKAYTAKSGAQQFKPSFTEFQNVIEQDSNVGFCLACGCDADGIEPDARKCHCEVCDADKVYGAEELLLMGLYH